MSDTPVVLTLDWGEEIAQMNPIVLFLLTTVGAFALHILLVFVLVSKKK